MPGHDATYAGLTRGLQQGSALRPGVGCRRVLPARPLAEVADLAGSLIATTAADVDAGFLALGAAPAQHRQPAQADEQQRGRAGLGDRRHAR